MSRSTKSIPWILFISIAACLILGGCTRGGEEAKTAPAAIGQKGEEAGYGQEGPGHDHEHAHEPPGLIHVDEATQTLIKLATEKVTVGDMPAVINAPATISPNLNATAKVGSKVKGRAVKVMVNPGDFVKKDAPLALLSSSEAGEARSNLIQAKTHMDLAAANLERQKKQEAKVVILEAKAKLDLAEKVLERQRRLYENKVVAKKEVEAAEAGYEQAKAGYEYAQNIDFQRETQAREMEYANAKADFERAKQALSIIGVRPDEVGNDVSSAYHIYSPLTGTVVERKINVGELADENTDLFTLMDLSRVWMFAEIYENLIPQVKLGQEVRLRVSPYPDRSFKGKVSYISPVIDPQTRTIRIRAEIENKSLLLKPEMFGEAKIVTGVNKKVISIPETAVLNEEGLKAVFVKVGDGYEKRMVEEGNKFEGRVEITSGLGEEEEVVTTGAFQLKAQAMKGAGVSGTHAEHGHEH